MDSIIEASSAASSPVFLSSVHHRTKKNLTNHLRQSIFETLLIRSKDGKLKRGCQTEVAVKFSVHIKTVRRIWQRGIACMENGLMVNVSSKLTNSGRKQVQLNFGKVTEIPLRRRTNIRSLSKALNLPKSTVHRRIKEGKIRPHSNALKPYLSKENKRARLRFCLSMLKPNSLQGQPMFESMYDYVHIDEKWFYISKEAERYYLLPEEEEPHRCCKSKRFITKVMFLVAVARPRFDENKNEEFLGKIEIWPFTYKEPAKKNSKNRAAGTLETKAIVSVTKDVIRACLIEKVLSAIQSKWPCSSAMNTIFIQQDNARPQVDPFDVEFLEAASREGFDIRLSYQPPNSPDMNVLDLEYLERFNLCNIKKHPQI
ncbi:uncharacterized protein LOC114265064 [Camellia sinensis]|uniref:uncharacterized protein LOC114265064 n=1 Tax=Camellia sinensis TaxID=4442 RepID=UPI0010357E51|nr:uncharacterized protein LOC114265064 [Camellia sinensis]